MGNVFRELAIGQQTGSVLAQRKGGGGWIVITVLIRPIPKWCMCIRSAGTLKNALYKNENKEQMQQLSKFRTRE
jgi:hypothetical protein